MTEYKRWYDKIPELQRIMFFIENLPVEQHSLIAKDLFQLVSKEIEDIDIKLTIQEIQKSRTYTKKRWYDMNSDLADALELIRVLSSEQQVSVLTKFVETMCQFYAVESNEY